MRRETSLLRFGRSIRNSVRCGNAVGGSWLAMAPSAQVVRIGTAFRCRIEDEAEEAPPMSEQFVDQRLTDKQWQELVQDQPLVVPGCDLRA